MSHDLLTPSQFRKTGLIMLAVVAALWVCGVLS